MILRKNMTFCLITIFLVIFSFSSYTVFAQEDGGGEDGPITPVSNTEVNPYLPSISTDAAPAQKTPAQTANGKLSGDYTSSRLSCPYAFERDIYTGVQGEDVRLLQVILNSDVRTKINTTGPGSTGQETTTFGSVTKDALKKFQALFIEYIGIANGRFGPRTRTVMNAICNGTKNTNSNQSYNNVQNVKQTVQQTSTQDNTQVNSTSTAPTENIPPRVTLSANLNAVQKGDYFKVIVYASEPINKFTPDAVIVDGGTVGEIRKLGPATYTMTINPNDDAKIVYIQIESEKIQDLAGNLNENASNEIIVKVVTPVIAGVPPITNTTPVSTTSSADIDSILNKIIASAPNCTYNTNGTLITGTNINTTGCPTQSTSNSQTGYYTCYGQQIPNTQSCPYNGTAAGQQQAAQQAAAAQQAQQGQAMQQLGQSLGSLLGKLLGSFGGGSGSGSGQGGGGSQSGGGGNTNGTGGTTNGTGQQTAGTQSNGQQTQQSGATDPCTKDPSSVNCLIKKDQGNTQNTPSKSPDKIVEKLKICSNERKIFCFDDGQVTDETKSIFLLRKDAKPYLIYGLNLRLKLEELIPNSCILQQPDIKPNLYGPKTKLIGCVGPTNMVSECKAKKVGKPDDPSLLGNEVLEWKGNDSEKDPILRGQTCNKTSDTSNANNTPPVQPYDDSSSFNSRFGTW